MVNELQSVTCPAQHPQHRTTARTGQPHAPEQPHHTQHATMGTTGSDDDDDAFGSFDDDGFGSFEDGDPTGAATTVPDADQPTHDDVTETANNNTEAEVDGGSLLPPPDTALSTDFPADVDAGVHTPKDTAGGDESAATASEESPAQSNDISPEPEQESQESDAPLALPSPSPSPSPPEIPSAEEAMETADETASAPEATTAPLPHLALPDDAADATIGMDGAGSAAPAMMTMTSPPPINIGEISADNPDDDPFASLGGAADAPLPVLSGSADAADGGFGSFGGFGDMSGGDDAAAPSSATADVDAGAGVDTSIPKAESGTEENKVEATSVDVPTADPGKVETLPEPMDDGGVDLLGAFPSEKEEETSEAEDIDMNINVTDTIGAEGDATSTELPSPTPNANPPLDQLSSFVTAATEEEQVAGTEDVAPSTKDHNDGEDIDNDGNNDDEDEDDCGGFENAASEEEEKKDGSPIADKMSMTAISDTVDSTNAIPPALPLETSEDVTPAETLAAQETDSFGAFGDGAGDGAVADDDNGGDKEMDIPKAESTDERGDYEETTDSAAAAFGAFGDISSSAEDPTPISNDLPAEAEAVQVQVMDVGAAGTEDISPVDTKDDTPALEIEAVDTGNGIVTETVELPASEPDNAVSNGFDAFAEVSAPSHGDAEMSMEPVETNNKSTEEDADDEDDGFEAFAEAPAVAEENEEPTGFVGEFPPSNNDVLANDMPESPDEHIPEPVESAEEDFDAFEEAPVAIAANEGSDLVAINEDGNDDGFDAFAEAPAPSPSTERVYKIDASDAPAPAPAPDSDDDSKSGEGATKEEDDDNDDDEFGDFDAFAEAPASSAPPNDTHQVDEFDAPVPVPAPVATMEASEPGEEKAEEDAEVEQQQEEQNGDNDDDESDDDFGDFGDFGGISEAGEIPASEEVNCADMAVESETPQQEAAAPAAAPEKDSDDEDDDFGDFGDFDEAPAPEPAAVTDAIPASTAPKADPIPTDQGFATSFEEQAATPMGHSTPAESDPIIQKATVVCKGMFQQYAPSPLEEEGEGIKEIASIPVKSILDSVLAGEDSGPTAGPSSTLSSKEKMENIFSETQIERGPAKLIMNYHMPKPYAQYAADSGADLKTDRGLSLEASSHSNDGDVFVPEVLSIDLPKESELSPEPRVPKSQVEPSAEFVDFPMSATRVVIPDKKEVNADEGGFANFGGSAASAEPATPTVAEPESAVDKFLAKIPDLSFMLSKELVLPK